MSGEATIALIEETPVITAFLERDDGRVLLLRRSQRARTYPGAWSGVSGYLELADPLEQAYVEISEETGIGREDLELRAAARPRPVTGPEGARWLVYPFLLGCHRPEAVRLSEENDAAEWIEPRTLRQLETVPALEEAYVDAKMAGRVERVADDDTHGASWLAREAVEAVAEAIELGEDPIELARAMVAARPAMGAICGALGRVLAAGRSPEHMIEEARALMASRERAARAIAVLLQPHLDGVGVVMTHSNSATVSEALLHTPPDRVVCTVSEPGEEGRELEELLRAEGLTTELVNDEDAGHAAKTVNLLLIGGDTVFRDGSLINKTGTRDLTKEASGAGIPVLVACEVIKLAPVHPREPGEDRFDLTPPEQIDSYVTEEGIFAPADIPALLDRTPYLREGYALLQQQSV
jgi:translation initiation factor 2B subunit (eIF-2B alpha/beta/delta family)/ADP-ribose pyrophosphatase YjhB (NUDIX family)